MAEPFDLNLRHLRALPAIIARGSMSMAAETAGLSQPALTQGIAKLERQLEVRLFDRHADGMTATPAGLTLAARAEAALNHLSAAVRSGIRGFSRPERLMTGTQLRAFLALADAGGFVRAATATGLSQPALHRAVREIEQVCGVPLVERRGRGVALTPRGHRFARGVRLAGAELAAGIAELSGDAGEAGTLIIGAMPLSRARVLPQAVARFIARYPQARIDVVEGSWRELIDPLLDGVLDLTVGALREQPIVGAVQTPLLVDRLAVIGGAGHPLANGKLPSCEALTACSWIAGQAGTPLRAQWEALFAGGPLPHAPVECGSVMVVRELLRQSDFLTLLSPDQVALEIDAGVLVSLGVLPNSNRTIGITKRESWRPTAAQQHFIDILHDVATLQEIE